MADESSLPSKLDGSEGNHVQEIHKTALFADSEERRRFLYESSNEGNRALTLYRTPEMELVCKLLIVREGYHRVKVPLDALTEDKKYFVVYEWAPSQLKLSITPAGETGSPVSDISTEALGNVRRTKTGELVQVGDKGVDVGQYSINQDGDEVLRSTGKESFFFTVEQAENLLKVASGTDQFLVETTAVQQIIVVLVTGLESYLSERFVELSEGISESELLDALETKFYGDKNDLRQLAADREISVFELPREKYFNFQDLSEASSLYDAAFGFNLESFLNQEGYRATVERNLDRRHKIIHESIDMTMLNREKVPQQEPEFADEEYATNVIAEFSNLVEHLHTELASEVSEG